MPNRRIRHNPYGVESNFVVVTNSYNKSTQTDSNDEDISARIDFEIDERVDRKLLEKDALSLSNEIIFNYQCSLLLFLDLQIRTDGFVVESRERQKIITLQKQQQYFIFQKALQGVIKQEEIVRKEIFTEYNSSILPIKEHNKQELRQYLSNQKEEVQKYKALINNLDVLYNKSKDDLFDMEQRIREQIEKNYLDAKHESLLSNATKNIHKVCLDLINPRNDKEVMMLISAKIIKRSIDKWNRTRKGDSTFKSLMLVDGLSVSLTLSLEKLLFEDNLSDICIDLQKSIEYFSENSCLSLNFALSKIKKFEELVTIYSWSMSLLGTFIEMSLMFPEDEKINLYQRKMKSNFKYIESWLKEPSNLTNNSSKSFKDITSKLKIFMISSLEELYEFNSIYGNVRNVVNRFVWDKYISCGVSVSLKLLQNDFINKEPFLKKHMLLACDYNIISVVHLILKRMKDLNDLNDVHQENNTCLFFACQKGYKEIASLLLDHNINYNKCNKEFGSPFYVSCRNGFLNVVNLFKNKKINTKEEVLNGTTPLIVALKNNNLDIVREIITWPSIDLNQMSYENKEFPLFVAVYLELVDIVSLLLDTGRCNIHLENCFGFTVAHTACVKDNINIVKILADNGSDFHKAVLVEGRLQRPIDIASEHDNKEVVQYLSERFGQTVNMNYSRGLKLN